MKNKHYIQKKFFYFYSTVIISIVSISFMAFYIYIYNTLEKKAINTLTNMSNMTINQLDTLFRDMDNLALQIISNPTIIKSLADAKKNSNSNNYFENRLNDRREIISTLTSINGPNIFSNRISIYNYLGDYVNTGIYPDSYTYIHSQLQTDDFKKWYDYILTLKGHRILLGPKTDKWSIKQPHILFSLIREIKDINFSYGIVEIQMDYNKIKNICDNFNFANTLNTYIIDSYGKPIYPYTETLTKENDILYKHYEKATHNKKDFFIEATNPITKNKEIIAFNKSNISGWTLLYVQPYKDFFAPIKLIGVILIIVAIFLITASLLLIFYMTNHLTKPLKALRKSINEVSLKNLSVDISHTQYNNELEQLNDAFFRMFSRLESSMDEVVHLRTSEHKAHILALQSQMNPHFLYNTLAVINASAIENDYIKICNMCSKLSNILRYTSNFSTTLVSIEDEIKNTTDYLDLMKERFEDGLTYTIKNHNPNINIRVPKLILQPIIENCFSHGFADKRPPWIIEVNIHLNEKTWIMDIYDNGTGFDDDKLKNIINKLNEFYISPSHNINNLHIGGLALLNTLIRLKFTYKEQMIFNVTSDKNYGTKIEIGGPIND